MPIDENIIIQKIKELEDASNTSDRKTATLRRLKYRLEKILPRQIPDPNDSTKRIPGPPLDEGVNKSMKPARRQELYDSIIAEVDSELS